MTTPSSYYFSIPKNLFKFSVLVLFCIFQCPLESGARTTYKYKPTQVHTSNLFRSLYLYNTNTNNPDTIPISSKTSTSHRNLWGAKAHSDSSSADEDVILTRRNRHARTVSPDYNNILPVPVTSHSFSTTVLYDHENTQDETNKNSVSSEHKEMSLPRPLSHSLSHDNRSDNLNNGEKDCRNNQYENNPGSDDNYNADKCYNHEKPNTVESSLYSYISRAEAVRPANYFNETITLGFFSPYHQNQMSLGAMRLAVEVINNSTTLLPGRTLKFTAVDIGRSDLPRGFKSLPIRIMTEMRDNGTVVFIGGPEDSCESEALVSAAWNLPMISFKCSDPEVSDKSKYYTFARTLPPSSKVSKSLVALLKTFSWNKVVLVVCLRNPYHILIDAFTALAKNQSINITDHYSLTDYIPANFPEMERIVELSYARTRVYVFIGEHVALIHLMRAMDDKKLFDKGEYMIITVDDQLDLENYFAVDYLDPYLKKGTDHMLKAYRSVLKLTPFLPRDKNFTEIERKFANYSTEDPFCIPYHPTIFPDTQVPVEAAYLYDAVVIYARALHELLETGADPRNGTAIFERIRNRSYHSIQGYDVFIDANGDAEGNYTVAALQDLKEGEVNESAATLTMSMFEVGYFQQASDAADDTIPTFKYFDEQRQIKWVKGIPPIDEPQCGFRGEKCVYQPDWKTIVLCSVFASVGLLGAILVARYYRYEQKLACLLWKIDMRDVIMIPLGAPEPLKGTKNTVALCRQLVGTAVDGSDAPLEFNCKKAYTTIGFYKGIVVAVKPIYKRSIDLTRNIRKELKQIREFRHENIIPFIGASVENGSICILTAYSARGSLEDVLQNEDLHLDKMFLASLVADLIKGMIYLHDSEIICHGNLKSSNCLVDSRWVLQIADFGLHEFKANEEHRELGKEQRKLLWRAPELLRDPNAPARGTQKGDVYSFGIVLFEMIGRSGPWGKTELSVPEIIKRVSDPQLNLNEKVLRPATLHLDCGETILKCLDACWEEDPDLRPDFRYIRVRLKEMQAGLKPNIFDNMLSIMEKYACNLEEIVQERTTQLTEEKKKTDALLHRMLPKSVADSLKRGEPVEAESFDSVTIYFSDVVGFTALSAVSTPMQVVELLNDLYTCFDSIISHYDVYKVETIGDAYMVVSGLPLRNGDQHAGEVASMALHLLDRIQNFEIRHRPGERLKLRIGIHSGPVVSGVVGLKMPRYCLFGDTVNTASRMESSGDALKIHISDVTKGLLEILGGYHYEERGLIPIKGKGEMCTYWLTGEDPSRTRRNSTESTDTAVVGSPLNNNCPLSNGASPKLGINGFVLTTDETSIISSGTEEHNNLLVKSYKPTTWLLADCNGKIENGNVKTFGGKYVSCSNVFQECKANIIKELKRNGTTNNATNRIRSAPIITFIERATNSNPHPVCPYEEPNFV